MPRAGRWLGTFKPGPARRIRISRTRWVLLGAAGLALVAIGLSKLRRFLQRYPVPDQRHPQA